MTHLTRRTALGSAAALAGLGLLDHVPGRAQAQAQAARHGTLKVSFLGLDTADPHRHTGSIAV